MSVLSVALNIGRSLKSPGTFKEKKYLDNQAEYQTVVSESLRGRM